tara:strand:+ start:278 stop:502 length:225 start_codon:yes stop_codon:yes gene_type:complete
MKQFSYSLDQDLKDQLLAEPTETLKAILATKTTYSSVRRFIIQELNTRNTPPAVDAKGYLLATDQPNQNQQEAK